MNDGEERRVQLRRADARGGHGEEAAGARPLARTSSGRKAALDRTKDLYGLHELLDQARAGLEQYVDLVLRCVKEAGADRPSMGEVVGEIERVLKMAGGPGTHPDPESAASNSMRSYASRTPRHSYGGDSSLDYTGGGMPSARVESEARRPAVTPPLPK